jgi:hypothetical protein
MQLVKKMKIAIITLISVAFWASSMRLSSILWVDCTADCSIMGFLSIAHKHDLDGVQLARNQGIKLIP